MLGLRVASHMCWSSVVTFTPSMSLRAVITPISVSYPTHQILSTSILKCPTLELPYTMHWSYLSAPPQFSPPSASPGVTYMGERSRAMVVKDLLLGLITLPPPSTFTSICSGVRERGWPLASTTSTPVSPRYWGSPHVAASTTDSTGEKREQIS